MPGIYTFTIEPTADTVVWGLLNHAYLIAALICLSGLLFGSRMLQEDPS